MEHETGDCHDRRAPPVKIHDLTLWKAKRPRYSNNFSSFLFIFCTTVLHGCHRNSFSVTLPNATWCDSPLSRDWSILGYPPFAWTHTYKAPPTCSIPWTRINGSLIGFDDPVCCFQRNDTYPGKMISSRNVQLQETIINYIFFKYRTRRDIIEITRRGGGGCRLAAAAAGGRFIN